jgi:hypothetical protein
MYTLQEELVIQAQRMEFLVSKVIEKNADDTDDQLEDNAVVDPLDSSKMVLVDGGEAERLLK